MQQLRADLESIRNDAVCLRGGDPSTTARRYLSWANDSARRLRSQLSPGDVDRLVLTRRHWHLVGLSGVAQSHLGDLVSTELDDRVVDFDRILADLDQERARWWRDGVYVVADTSCFIEHPVKIDCWDLADTLDTWSRTTRLIMPILVIDQLDGLKQSKDRRTRWRARHTLHVIDKVLQNPREGAELRKPHLEQVASNAAVPRGHVTVEIVFDPPDHVRLPVDDDEIIDRALAIQTTIGRPIRFLTYDTGQSTRARAVGLDVMKLEQPPDGEESTRGPRSERPRT